MRSVPSLAASVVLVLGGLAACGDDDSADDSSSPGTEDSSGLGPAGNRPTVVVTTNIVGDMVSAVLGDQADVEVIMPLGSDPHDFAASARQAESMAEADLLVVNGAGFEEGLVDLIDSAEDAGAPVFAFSDQVELLEASGGHAEEDDEHAEEEGEHAEEEDGEHAEEGSDDPHIWTDPSRMAGAIDAFADRAAELDGVDGDAIADQAAAYVDELDALDAAIEDRLGDVPTEQRVLVTNHEVFGYFADRYDFEVIGAVIPSQTTNAEASAADIEELAALIRDEDVPAIFGETTQPSQLADALAEEAGSDVEVVELFTESLGENGSGAETYITMMELNAQRIGDALA